jgi:hypothetical protein
VTTELIKFVHARWDEERGLACAAERLHPAPWRLDPEVETNMPDGRWVADAADEGVLVANGDAAAKLFARHGPGRLLADIALKRALLDAMIGPALSSPVARTHDAGLAVARYFALAYADHPDYRPEWAP